MSDYGLMPDDVRKRYNEEVLGGDGFKPHGVSKQHALQYLDTEEGRLFRQAMIHSSPETAPRILEKFALQTIMSGRDLPRMRFITEPLFKLGSPDEPPHAKTPYFAREADLMREVAAGYDLNQRFALPARSELPVYGGYQIRPIAGAALVFESEVAPSSELGGQVRRSGGTMQYLVLNREHFTDAEMVNRIGNNLAADKELVVSRSIQASTGVDGALRLRPGAAAKGLAGIAGAAVLATYDAADAAHEAAALNARGNAAGAEDRITRFATRSVGVGTGAALGAAATSGSGPGVVVGTVLGGIVGHVAGDQAADYIRDYKINHQRHAGKLWTFDPDHPGRGWTVEIPPLPGSPRGERLTADERTAHALDFKASSRAIELALATPPASRDPYRLAVDTGDMSPRDPFETGRDWVRDGQGKWQQEIRAMHDGRTATVRFEPATRVQAEELERQSQAITEDNAERTPASMAARFRDAYELNGWHAYPMPLSVSNELGQRNRIVASDGNLYQRDGDGQWTNDRWLLPDARATRGLAAELDATYRAQQARLDPTTLETVAVRPDPVQGLRPRDPRDPGHPDHAMHQTVQEKVLALYGGHGVALGGYPLEQVTAAVMRDARAAGIARVETVNFTADPMTGRPDPAGSVMAWQGDPTQPWSRASFTPVEQAMQTQPEAAYRQFEQDTQQQARAQAHFEQRQSNEQSQSQGAVMQR